MHYKYTLNFFFFYIISIIIYKNEMIIRYK